MNEAEYIKIDLSSQQIEVYVEIYELGSVKNRLVIFQHKISDDNGWFESIYKGEKITVNIKGNELIDFTLPKDFIGLSKDRIKKGINEYINRLLN